MKAKHEWIRQFFLPSEAKHTLFLGESFTGKTYFASWLLERMIDRGEAKPFILKCTNEANLSESLGFCVPNKLDKKNYRRYLYGKSLFGKDTLPKGYKVRVFKPVSVKCGNRYPINFRPFTVNLKDINETGFKVLVGTKDHYRLWGEFRGAVNRLKKDDSVAEFKKFLMKKRTMNGSGFYRFEMTPMGYKEVVPDSEVQTQTIASLENRFSYMRNNGFFCSPNSKYDLRKQLMEELLVKDRVVVLDTSDIPDATARFFIIVYFMELVVQIMLKEKYIYKIKYKLVFFLDDVRDLFPKSEKKSELEVIATEITTSMLATYRHAKIDLYYSVQSMMFIEKSSRKNWKFVYVTRFYEDEDVKWLATMVGERTNMIQLTMKTFETLANKGEYRFIDVNNPKHPIPLSRDGRDRGFELPYPRRSMHGKVNTSSYKELGLPIVDLFKRAKAYVWAKGREDEEMLKEKLSKQVKLKSDEQISLDRVKLITETVKLWRVIGSTNAVARQLRARGGDLKKTSREKVDNLLAQAVDIGLISSEEIEQARKVVVKAE